MYQFIPINVSVLTQNNIKSERERDIVIPYTFEKKSELLN